MLEQKTAPKNEAKPVRIMAEPQMDPNLCRFIIEQTLTEAGSFRFESKEQAEGSPLAEALFAIEGIQAVFIGGKIILITKNGQGSGDWRTLGPQIGQAIRKVISEDAPLISQKAKEALPNEAEIKEKVEKILTEQVNPQVASHGGFIELLDVKQNDIYIKMGGGCQGCASSQATLKQGVEQSLRREIPLLGTVYDTTDHAAGTNPYYQA